MIDAGIQYVLFTQAKPIVVTDKEVFVRTNIEKVTPKESKHPHRIYKCHEYRYRKEEYFATEMQALSNSEQLLVDQEYRLTMLELMSDATL